MLSLEIKSSALDKYATLPRRKRERTPECQQPSATTTTTAKERLSRSRDTSLTRSFTTRSSNISVHKKPQDCLLTGVSTNNKYLPPYPLRKKPTKTKIYHETYCQTALTNKDLEKLINGKVTELPTPDRIEKCARSVQCEITDSVADRKLKKEFEDLTEKCGQLQSTVTLQQVTIVKLEEDLRVEREEKNAAKEELSKNTERIVAMLRTADEGKSL